MNQGLDFLNCILKSYIVNSSTLDVIQQLILTNS